jgi:phosphoserine phosphatase RsbU/P
MSMNKWKLFSVSIIVLMVSFFPIYFLFPDVHPMGGMVFKTSPELLKTKSLEIARQLGVSPENYDVNIDFRYNNQLIKRVQKKYGLEKGNELLRSEYPGYYWRVELVHPDVHSTPHRNPERIVPVIQRYEHIRLQFDSQGYLFSIETEIPDSLILDQPGLGEAREIAANLIKSYTAYKNISGVLKIEDSLVVSSQVVATPEGPGYVEAQSQRKDYDFTWNADMNNADNEVEIKVSLKGNLVSRMDIRYIDAAPEDDQFGMVNGIINAVLMILISIQVVYLGYKKIKSNEIRFKLAIYLAVTIGILLLIHQLFVLDPVTGWLYYITLFISPILIGSSFIIAFSVSESVGREIWKEKFIPLDLFTAGHFFHSHIGLGILRGVTIGMACFTLLLTLTWLANKIFPLTAIFTSEVSFNTWTSFNPLLAEISHNLWTQLYLVTVFVVLLTSYLFSLIKKRFLVISLIALSYTVINGIAISPTLIGIIIQTIVYAILIWTLFENDIWVTFFAILSYVLAPYFVFFGLNTHTGLITSLVIVGLLIAYVLWCLVSRDKVSDFSEIEPALGKYISERQRMQQELNIAREVQMGLLPRVTPIFKNLEIAADCVPAQEVGGDYYDFIRYDQSKLAIVIGDVSGKGIKAAFYMTLVKGFLKALSRYAQSPAEILKELNFLFFENTRSDAFISMIFGIFDMTTNELIIARSGHNPALHYHKDSNTISTIHGKGLAIGLEKGELFDKMIEENRIVIQPGDLFIFYTDGLTEAMNKSNEQFSEESLEKLIKEHCNKAPAELIKVIYREVDKFSKGKQQHDDMTLVIVKVE